MRRLMRLLLIAMLVGALPLKGMAAAGARPCHAASGMGAVGAMGAMEEVAEVVAMHAVAPTEAQIDPSASDGETTPAPVTAVTHSCSACSACCAPLAASTIAPGVAEAGPSDPVQTGPVPAVQPFVTAGPERPPRA